MKKRSKKKEWLSEKALWRPRNVGQLLQRKGRDFRGLLWWGKVKNAHSLASDRYRNYDIWKGHYARESSSLANTIKTSAGFPSLNASRHQSLIREDFTFASELTVAVIILPFMDVVCWYVSIILSDQFVESDRHGYCPVQCGKQWAESITRRWSC